MKSARVRSRPFQIEFIGLPGAGKSTLADALIEHLTSKHFQILERKGQQSAVAPHYKGLSRKERMASFVDFCEQHDELVFELARLSLSLRPLHRAGLRRSGIFLKQCQNASLFWETGASHDFDFIIQEQDIVQELWSVIYLRKFSEVAVRRIMFLIQDWLPDLIVFIDLDGKTAKQRMADRATRLNRFTGEIDAMVNFDTKMLDRSNHDTKNLGELGTEFGAEMLVVDGLDSVTQSTATILAHLNAKALLYA